MLHGDVLTQERAGAVLELVGVFSSQVSGCAALRATTLHVGMMLEIALQTFGHKLTLRNDAHTWRHILQYLGHEQRIVGTTQDNSVDFRVEPHELVDALLHKIVSAR